MTAVSDEAGRELEPTYLEAAKRLLIGAIVGSCTCNTKSPELVWHMPHCRYVTLTYALENVENALSASPVAQEPVARLCGYCKTWNSKPCGEQCYLQPNDPVWTSPPATSAGVGAEEIARALANSLGMDFDEEKRMAARGHSPSQNYLNEWNRYANAILALLSRGSGDQSHSTHEA